MDGCGSGTAQTGGGGIERDLHVGGVGGAGVDENRPAAAGHVAGGAGEARAELFGEFVGDLGVGDSEVVVAAAELLTWMVPRLMVLGSVPGVASR